MGKENTMISAPWPYHCGSISSALKQHQVSLSGPSRRPILVNTHRSSSVLTVKQGCSFMRLAKWGRFDEQIRSNSWGPSL